MRGAVPHPVRRRVDKNMELTKGYIAENIFLSDTDGNANLDVINGLLLLQVESSDKLNEEADRIRVIEGYRPLFSGDGCYDGAWYNYYVLCRRDRTLGLTFEVEDKNGPGDSLYAIELGADTKRLLFERVSGLVGPDDWRKAFEAGNVTGERIRYTAGRRGISIRELSAKTGQSSAAIRRYMRGEGIPDGPVIEAIASVLGVPAGYLAGNTDDPGVSASGILFPEKNRTNN